MEKGKKVYMRCALRSTVRVSKVPEHVFQDVLPREKERNP